VTVRLPSAPTDWRGKAHEETSVILHDVFRDNAGVAISGHRLVNAFGFGAMRKRCYRVGFIPAGDGLGAFLRCETPFVIQARLRNRYLIGESAAAYKLIFVLHCLVSFELSGTTE
jgi:hypothetical protein